MSQKTTAREYLRVSKDRDGRGKSPEQQHEDNARAVASRGWELHPVAYADPGISASRYTRKRREGFGKLLDDLEAGAFEADVLVLWESSRGSRRVGEWITLIELCEERGVSILVTTHGREYDPGNARDRRSMLEDAVDSEYEVAKTSERIRRDVRAAAERGRVHGKNMYGYQRVYEALPSGRQVIKEIVPHPEQAPVVQEAARRVLAGDSMYSIARDFNARGVPPRRRSFKEHRRNLGWTMAAVRQMLQMESYSGRRVHTDTRTGAVTVHEASWPALIEPADFDKIQRLIAANRRQVDWRARHLLSGLVTCAECGNAVRVGKQNAGRRVPVVDEQGKPVLHTEGQHAGKQKHRAEATYHTYVCQGAPGKAAPGRKSAFHVAMKEDYLDALVVEAVLARVSRPDFLATVGRQEDEADAERTELLERIEKLEDHLEQAKALAAQELDMTILLDQRTLVLPQIEEVRRRLEALADTDPEVLALAGRDDVEEAWEAMDIEVRRRVIRALVAPVLSRATKRGVRGVDQSRVQMHWR